MNPLDLLVELGILTKTADGKYVRAKADEIDTSKFVSAEDFGKTAALIRELKKAVDALKGTGNPLDALVELGLLAKGDDGKLSLPEQKKAEPKPGDDAVSKELEKLRKQMAQKDTELQQERERTAKQALNTATIAALQRAGAVKADRDFIHLAPQVILSGDQYVVKGKDKYNNEVEIPLGDFAKTFLEQNPELAQAKAAPGSGTPGGQPGNTPGTKGQKIPQSQWSDMEWYAKNAEKFRTGEYVRGYDE